MPAVLAAAAADGLRLVHAGSLLNEDGTQISMNANKLLHVAPAVVLSTLGGAKEVGSAEQNVETQIVLMHRRASSGGDRKGDDDSDGRLCLDILERLDISAASAQDIHGVRGLVLCCCLVEHRMGEPKGAILENNVMCLIDFGVNTAIDVSWLVECGGTAALGHVARVRQARTGGKTYTTCTMFGLFESADSASLARCAELNGPCTLCMRLGRGLDPRNIWRKLRANPDTSSYDPVTGFATFCVPHFTRPVAAEAKGKWSGELPLLTCTFPSCSLLKKVTKVTVCVCLAARC